MRIEIPKLAALRGHAGGFTASVALTAIFSLVVARAETTGSNNQGTSIFGSGAVTSQACTDSTQASVTFGGEFLTTGSVAQAIITRSVDGLEAAQTGVIQPQDFQQAGRNKTAAWSDTMSLPNGAHTVVYCATQNSGQGCATITLSVDCADHGTTTTIVDPGNVYVGDLVLFEALVAKQDAAAPGMPTGNVDFELDGNAAGTMPLTAGAAGLTVVPTAIGSIQVGANYNGGPSSTDATFDYDASTAADLTKTINHSLYVALVPEGSESDTISLARMQVDPSTKTPTAAQYALTAAEGDYNVADTGIARASRGVVFIAGNVDHDVQGLQANIGFPFENTVNVGVAASFMSDHPTVRRLYISKNAGATASVEYVDFDETADTAAPGVGTLIHSGGFPLTDTELRGTAISPNGSFIATIHIFPGASSFTGVKIYSLDGSGNLGSEVGSASLGGRPVEAFFASNTLLIVQTLDDGLFSYTVDGSGALTPVDSQTLLGNFSLDVAMNSSAGVLYSLDLDTSTSPPTVLLSVITFDGSGNLSAPILADTLSDGHQNLCVLGDGSAVFVSTREPGQSHVVSYVASGTSLSWNTTTSVQDPGNSGAKSSVMVSSK